MILESKSNACTRDVGRNSVAHSAAQRGRAYSADAGLSPQPGPWRNLLFHGQFAGPALECLNLLVRHIDALRDAVRRLRTRAPFRVDAWVVLPDHMHCLWSLPEGDADFPGRWRAIKIAVGQVVADRRTAIGGYGQTRRTRYLAAPLLGAHRSPSHGDSARHFDYIHFNPVKHGLVELPAVWPYSTFRRCLASGIVSKRLGGRC